MKRKIKLLLIISFLIIALDQFTKFLIVKNLALYESIAIIPNYLYIVNVQNTGGAFSFLANSSQTIRFLVFIVFSLLAILFILYMYLTTQDNELYNQIALAMIFSGACGNMIDRIRLGFVTDFIDCYYKNYHWPAFNVADSSITIGLVFLTFLIIKGK